MTKWRFIDTGINNASWNMSIDEMLLNNYKEASFPILRLYEWEPSLSFGRFSKVSKNINLSQLSHLSYARRITGGGILVHGGDISYSLFLSQSYLDNLSVKKSYSFLCSFLINFYKELGLNALFASQANVEYQKDDICLKGKELYDILIKDEKIGGNAQRYSKNMVFQHGSIPLSFNKRLFEPLFKKGSGIEETSSLYKVGIRKDRVQLKEMIKDSFSKSFKCELIDDKLTLNEIKKAKHLFETKYSKDSWNIDGKFNS